MSDQSARPVPLPDDTTRFFWDGAAERRLLLQRCDACSTYQYPPDVVCITCQSLALTPTEVSGRATLYSFIEMERAFHAGFVPHLPIVLALVELDEQPGLRMLTNIVDAEGATLEIGMALEVTYEERGDIVLPQFKPAGVTL